MKNIKIILLFISIVTSFTIYAQDQKINDSNKIVKLKESEKLYRDLQVNENNPLLIINGIEIENQIEFLTLIDPQDIKDLSVLKDGNPVELYGEKAKYGVLIITLKDKKINTLEKLNHKYLNNKNQKEFTISGTVLNHKKELVTDAVISNISKREAYYSDSLGNFKIKVAKNDYLIFSKVGFESQKIKVENLKNLNIVLIPTTASGKIKIKKPVIYLYPTEKTDITLSFHFNGKLLTTFPKYQDKWELTAYADGKIFDKATNRFYNSLFWDGTQNFPDEHYNYQTGFSVDKNNLVSFLTEKLETLGLNTFETNDFIQFWLPHLEQNETNFIHFYVNSEYDIFSTNNINPKPDTSIRVFMEFYKLENKIEIQEQKLPKTERKGFTLVEWGGADVTIPLQNFKNPKL